MAKRPVNPYIVGNALSGEKGFFGRQDTLDWVTRELRNPGIKALVLSGQRRIGKTSLLLQLQRHLPKDEFLPVYFDLEHETTRPLGKVLADLADMIAERAGMQPPDPKAFDDQGRYFQHTFLPQLYHSIPSVVRLVFLLDEFDVLDETAEEELQETAAAKALFPFLRRLMNDDPLPAFVFVIGRRPEDVSIDLSRIFKNSLKYEIWVLDRKSCDDLVRQAEENGTLKFTAPALDRIYSLTNGHPYLTQLLCLRLWQHAYQDDPPTPPLVDESTVDAAIPDALVVGQPALDWLWNGLGPPEKIYAGALAEIAQVGEVIPEDDVIQVISTNAPRLRTHEVEQAPKDLVNRRILDMTGDSQYRFAIELFQIWVKQNKPLNSVKDELDRLDKVADRLFSLGRDFYNRREWKDARRYFEEALDRYPEHFKARLYLGETLLKLEEYDLAVETLEQAYRKSESEVRLSLARALIQKAKASQEAGDEKEALQAAERALEISPNEELAKEIRGFILARQAERALKDGDLLTALNLFKLADDEEKLVQFENQLRQQAIKQINGRAREETSPDEWDQLEAFLEEAVRTYPKRKEWRDLVARVQQKKQLVELYSRALTEIKAGHAAEAVDLLSEIAGHQPDYKDTLYYLLKLVKGVDARELEARLQKEKTHAESLQQQVSDLLEDKRTAAEQIEALNKKLELLQNQPAETTFSKIIKRFSRPSKPEASPERQPADWVGTASDQSNSPPPMAQYLSSYKFGDDLYNESFSIDAYDGSFLGEWGIESSESLGVGEPKKVTAFEIWLFDKNTINTVTKVLSSEYAYRDDSINRRLEAKGELVLVEPGKEVVLRTETLQLVARIVDLTYGESALPPQSYFDRFIVEASVWQIESTP